MPGNILKLIAALSMLIDHVGLMFFPNQLWMRAVGRLAFPIFAFFIAEGFRYTRSKLRYLLTVFALGVACHTVYYIVTRSASFNVLITFSLSLCLLILLDKALSDVRQNAAEKFLYIAAFAAALLAVTVICHYAEVDYGLLGVMLPLWPSFAQSKRGRLCAFAGGLLPLCISAAIEGMPVQFFAYLALIPLFFYNEKPGKPRLKYFFYAFYPAHLALLWSLQAIIQKLV